MHVLLTLGAHVQRGLQYLVSVSVASFFCYRALQCAQQDIPSASAGHEQGFNLAFSLAMLRSGIMAIFAYQLKRPIFLYSTFVHPHTCLLRVECDIGRYIHTCTNVGLLPSISAKGLHFIVLFYMFMHVYTCTLVSISQLPCGAHVHNGEIGSIRLWVCYTLAVHCARYFSIVTV